MFKRITSAAFLAILMLCAFSVEAQTLGDFFSTDTAAKKPTLDTISVLLLVSDTSIIRSTAWHEWGYQVRHKYCCINGNTSNLSYYQPVPYYEHFMYLNNKKVAFKPGIVVWQTVAKQRTTNKYCCQVGIKRTAAPRQH